MSYRRRTQGFTLIELAITLAIFSILVLIGMPALLKILDRQSLISAAHQSADVLRLARFTAIKQGTSDTIARVKVDYANNALIAVLVPAANTCVTPIAPTDTVIARVGFPRGIALWGPNDAGAGLDNASSGFDEDAVKQGCADFLSTGAVAKIGSFRLRGKQGDFLEVRVDPSATGRVTVRKWFGGGDPDANWWLNGEDNHNWWS
jgi:prepilin-type N-terminal cleavage/methylation domain-containing protein